MAKPGLNPTTARNLLVQAAQHRGWVLCVGAGISRPVFPDWKQLVEMLVRLDQACVTKANEISEELLANFSPDGVIAAAFEKLNLSPNLLSEVLYRDLMARFTKDAWRQFARILADPAPGSWEDQHWSFFESCIASNWPNLTSTQIARALARVAFTERAPASVISFNAEPLLYSELNCHCRKIAPGNEKAFDLVVRSTSHRKSGRIPYYCVHGLLPIPQLSRRDNRTISNDKLVFSEADYLNLANSNYSWQSSNFISAASNSHMVFIGLSMTDSNIRKWLTWVQSLRRKEIEEHGRNPESSTSHYWIRTRPKSSLSTSWIESLVSHLGVRIVWIESWSDVETILCSMLAAC
jgi:hypothetical protein